MITLFVVLTFFSSTPATAGEDGTAARETARATDASLKPEERATAIQALGRSGDSRAAAPLLGILKDPLEEPGIRACAARSLGILGTNRRDVLAAMEAAYRETAADDNLRYTILLSLGNMKARETLSLFREALEDPDDTTRFKAVQALGELNDEEGVKLLTSRYEQEKDKIVRAEIVRALGGQGDPALTSFLIGALLGDPDALVRWNAALMITAYADPGPEAREALRKAENDPSPMVRQAAAGGAP